MVPGAARRVLNPSGGCHNCPRKRVDFAPSSLTAGPVLFLGEHPGATDVEQQASLVGEGGQLLRRVAGEVGVPGPWSFSNTIHCRPPDLPQPKEIGCCLSQMTLGELEDYSVIVLCGKVPLQALFPGAKGSHFRGNVAHHPDYPEKRFYAVHHPGYIIRRPDMMPDFTRQMARLARIVGGEPPPAWTVVRGMPGLEALRAMVRASMLSLDFETSGLESWATGVHIKSFAATADGKTVVAADADDPLFRPMMDLIVAYVQDEDKTAIGANIAFDLEFLERERGINVQCRLLQDVALWWYQAGGYTMPSLKELVSRELDGYRFLVHEPHLCRDPELLLKYNAEDVVHPIALMQRAALVVGPRTRDLVARVLGPVSLVLRRMTAHGFHVREQYRQEKIAEYEERRRTIVSRWREQDPEFIPDKYESGHGLLHYLYTVRDLPVLERTASEDPSTDQSVLKQLVRDGYGIVQNLLDLRELDKILSTYLRAYDKVLWGDGRVRSSYTLAYTDTGRSSSRGPNLQNIPRAKEIRDLFGVPDGSLLIESDLSQIEFRIMVCLAQDVNGIQAYLRGEDAHTVTARGITGAEVPTKAQRTLAKPVNFGYLYGAKAPTVQRYVADEYGVSWTMAEAERFRSVFMSTYPQIEIFHETSRLRLAQQRGHFESVVGHRFFYSDWDHREKGKREHVQRSALNSEAQGPAAHICFYIKVIASRLLQQRRIDFGFVNTVHDSILTEVPNPASAPAVVEALEEASQVAHQWVKSWFVVPLILEHASGQSWGSLKEIKV